EEWDGSINWQSIHGATRVEEQEHEDDCQRDRDHDAEPGLRALEIAVLTGPIEAVPRRDLHLVRDRLLRVAHVIVDRTARVGEYVAGQLPVLVPQHRGAGAEPEVGDLAQGELRAVHG